MNSQQIIGPWGSSQRKSHEYSSRVNVSAKLPQQVPIAQTTFLFSPELSKTNQKTNAEEGFVNNVTLIMMLIQ